MLTPFQANFIKITLIDGLIVSGYNYIKLVLGCKLFWELSVPGVVAVGCSVAKSSPCVFDFRNVTFWFVASCNW